jgi:hypothetical protein
MANAMEEKVPWRIRMRFRGSIKLAANWALLGGLNVTAGPQTTPSGRVVYALVVSAGWPIVAKSAGPGLVGLMTMVPVGVTTSRGVKSADVEPIRFEEVISRLDAELSGPFKLGPSDVASLEQLKIVSFERVVRVTRLAPSTFNHYIQAIYDLSRDARRAIQVLKAAAVEVGQPAFAATPAPEGMYR